MIEGYFILKMSKQHTLFNFFKRVSSPSTNSSNAESNVEQTPEPSDFVTPKKRKIASETGYEICDLIWAKLEGYPWWPSLICGHPNSGKHLKGNLVHVQFFDDPPTRAWISKRNIQTYSPDSEKKHPKLISSSEQAALKKACEAADKAFKMTIDERTKLLFNFNNASNLDSSNSNNENSPGTDKENENINSSNPRKKRKIFVFDSEDSEEEYKPDKTEEKEAECDDDESSGDDSNVSDEILTEDEEIEEEPKESKKRKRGKLKSGGKNKKMTLCSTPSNESRYSFSNTAKSKLSLFKNTPNATPKDAEEKTDDWPHLKLDFLQPDKIMDKNKRRPDHPDYDKRTLYVPESYKAKVTPGVRQWWELKTDNFDCILFFKVGKFYELYHMDAVIGVNELSLTYMRGEFAHSGFPEIAYGRFANILVQKGYKVARVEQTETPEMMNERCKKQARTSKFDRVVSREICQKTTKGTQIFSFIDGEAKESETNFLLALTEKTDLANNSVYGVCFIDTSIGTFHIGQFKDDKYLSSLRTLLSHHPPVQILYERNHISPKTMQLMKTSFASVMQEPLAPETEFWSAKKTLTTLSEEKYFLDESESGFIWPDAIQKFIKEVDALGLSPSDDGELALKALGATIWYLKQCFLEQQLLAMKKFEVYSGLDIPKLKKVPESEESVVDIGRYLILDGFALSNLEVLVNSNGEKTGTLLEKMDHCCTFSGKRLLRQWLCSPLCNIAGIKSRQKAVVELSDKYHLIEEVRPILKQIPDLERLLGRIHTEGNAIRSKTHPDSRAIYFEDKIYSKRKIQDFLSVLTGFEKLQKVIEMIQKESPFSSEALQKCIMFAPEGQFPNLRSQLKFFEDAFDHELAKKEGCIIPKSKGVDLEYDAVIDELNSLEREMKEYLKSQCQHFGVGIKYFGTDKNRFQLEIPDSAAEKTGSDYEFTSSRKGFKRYMTSKTKEFLRRQVKAEESKGIILKDLSRRIFEQFSNKYDEWITAVQCLAVVDVFMSIALYCRSEDGPMCLPEFSHPKEDVKPHVNIKNGRHPCITVENGFIPNDTTLAKEDFNSLILLTGPNMGGKSTLMRQLGLIVIMAHMGSQVPAESCELTLIDRIFTRIGASDDLIAGESTFYVELNETSLILNHATRYSLVLVDELGRGTSTYDGTAIAYSVVKELSEMQCRTLFSTHYHTLVEEFKISDSVSLGHMACMVETDEDDPSEETVTFLYKFAKGACPKSHGFNAAKLAGVPSHIIKIGREKADMLEKETERRKIFRKLFKVNVSDMDDINNLFNSIQLVV